MEVERINKSFLTRICLKAPASVIEGEKEKLKKYTGMYEKIIERRNAHKALRHEKVANIECII